jgi:hypothetical protein
MPKARPGDLRNGGRHSWRRLYILSETLRSWREPIRVPDRGYRPKFARAFSTAGVRTMKPVSPQLAEVWSRRSQFR